MMASISLDTTKIQEAMANVKIAITYASYDLFVLVKK